MSQWADDSMTPAPIKVSRDKYMNEIPSDQPMHTDATAGEGAFSWNEGHYAGEFSSYGTPVAAPSGVDKVNVDNSRADRGKEA